MASSDQGFREFDAKLLTTEAPYNPFTKRGVASDSAWYIQQPGINFMRPWLAIRGGAAFQWPLGLQGFSLSIDPTLGIHKYIGDNAVAVDVVHAGEEHFSMSGVFPGDSAPALIRALKDIIYKGSPKEGKLLWLPEIVTFVQRVQVVRASFDRDQESRGQDATYSIEFVRMGIAKVKFDPNPVPPKVQPTHPARGKKSRSIKVDAKHNSLRKIAAWKLGSSTKWRSIYNANSKWFIKNAVQLSKAPDHRLPIGMRVFF